MRIQYDVVTPYMRAQSGRADRAWAAKLEATVVRTNAYEVGVAIRIYLHAANKKHMVIPFFDSIKSMTSVAIRFRPTHNTSIPTKSRHRQTVQVKNIHARAEKNKF